MLKKWSSEIKGFIIGVILVFVISGTVVAASPTLREIFYGVRVIHNGNIIQFDEGSQPFIMNERTFIPVRAIAEIAGLNVDFEDGVVYLSSEEFVRNHWSGNVFRMEQLGFSFAMPPNWSIAAEPDYEMVAISPSGASVRIRRERLETSQQEFLDEFINAFAAANINFDSSLPARVLGNFSWRVIRTSMQMQILEIDLNIYGHYFINFHNGAAHVITILSSDVSESAEDILELFRGM
jgi:hypothetical protein